MGIVFVILILAILLTICGMMVYYLTQSIRAEMRVKEKEIDAKVEQRRIDENIVEYAENDDH